MNLSGYCYDCDSNTVLLESDDGGDLVYSCAVCSGYFVELLDSSSVNEVDDDESSEGSSTNDYDFIESLLGNRHNNSDSDSDDEDDDHDYNTDSESDFDSEIDSDNDYEDDLSRNPFVRGSVPGNIFSSTVGMIQGLFGGLEQLEEQLFSNPVNEDIFTSFPTYTVTKQMLDKSMANGGTQLMIDSIVLSDEELAKISAVISDVANNDDSEMSDDVSRPNKKAKKTIDQEVVDKNPDSIQVISDFEEDEEGIDCNICLMHFQVDQKVKRLECNHVFHSECLKSWFAKQNNCPVCRFNVTPARDPNRPNVFVWNGNQFLNMPTGNNNRANVVPQPPIEPVVPVEENLVAEVVPARTSSVNINGVRMNLPTGSAINIPNLSSPNRVSRNPSSSSNTSHTNNTNNTDSSHTPDT